MRILLRCYAKPVRSVALTLVSSFCLATPKGLRSTEGTGRCAVILALREQATLNVKKQGIKDTRVSGMPFMLLLH